MSTNVIVPAKLQHFCRRLSDAFGVPFSVWLHEADRWTTVNDVITATPELPECLSDWLKQRTDEPQVLQLPSGRTFLAACFPASEDATAVVCGELTLSRESLAMQLYQVTFDRSALEEGENERQQLLEDYSTRMIDSFEEMTFLRRLTQHLEYCDATRSLHDVAVTVLPQLRQLMQIESLGLVAAVPDPLRPGQSHSGDLIHQDGHFEGEPQDWRCLVNHHTLGHSGIIVRNAENGLSMTWSNCVEGVRSLVIAPVAKDGTLFGWLVGINKQTDASGDSSPSNSLSDGEIGSVETSLLEAAASLFSGHASNCQLFHEKEDLIVNLVGTLVGVIEAKDSYTCGHSDRVALMSKRLAKQLKLADEDCEDIYLAGLLHDIGKVGVADDVLLKPGKVTEEEFAQIKRHPVLGAKLLQGLRPYAKLIPGVLHHHENFDGTGYPHQLQGVAIPLMARVLAVADAFDAMTSDRPYRAGMTYRKAEQILRDGAGTQWDPVIVNAFFAAREDLYAITHKWQDHLRQVLSPAIRERHDPLLGRRQAAPVLEVAGV